MRLYSFFNSSTSYRVRIALAIKGLSYEIRPINIRTGVHRGLGFHGVINPSAGVPVLEIDGVHISQSLAIIDYLDTAFPEPPLIPSDPLQRAKVLSFANLIACDIHPLDNLRVLRYLQDDLRIGAQAKDAWYRHWIDEGFRAVEHMLGDSEPNSFCYGDTPSLADCCLVPQVANALRMECPMDPYPKIMAVYHHAAVQPAFQSAAPERQPDYVDEIDCCLKPQLRQSEFGADQAELR
jgi:maleylacetoacetate isomerase